MRKKIILLILVVFLAAPAFPTAVTLKIIVNNELGSIIGPGKAVQVIQPSAVTSPNATDYLVGGSIKTADESNGGIITTNANSYISATVGGLDQYMSQGIGGAVVRIWNATAAEIAGGILGKYYGYYSYNLKDGIATPFDEPLSPPGYAQTRYFAGVPTSPTIGAIPVAYVEKDGVLVGYATIPISADTNKYELAHTGVGPAYEVQIRPLGSASWTITKGSDGSSISTDPNVNAEKLAMGTTFEVQARCRSYFGTSDWSNTATFRTAGMATAGGAVTFIFDLKASAADKLVVNDISLPSVNFGVTNAKELINYINTQANEQIVTIVGKYDPANAKALGYKLGGEGTGFPLAAGEGCQVYVTKDYHLTLP